MSEEQETTTAEATVEPAETQENQAPSEVGESKEAQPQQVSEYNVPEGFEINDSMKTELDGLFKDSNINPETAQKIVDKHFEILGEKIFL
jgi:outer membrane protein OmpA-like peptidoglycan-associated protein